MNLREKRRLKRLRDKEIDAEFERLTKEEQERRKKKKQDKELVQQQFLAELEMEATGKSHSPQTSKRGWWRKKQPRSC